MELDHLACLQCAGRGQHADDLRILSGESPDWGLGLAAQVEGVGPDVASKTVRVIPVADDRARVGDATGHAFVLEDTGRDLYLRVRAPGMRVRQQREREMWAGTAIS
eukprot:scaffold6968_cov117-Isochrysis_galbana.AAC.2